MKQKQKEVITETTTEVITEKEWGIIQHFWEHFPGLIPAIRQYIPYTGMISPEEIENECILILAEALIQCKSKKRCEKCEITECEEYMRTLKTTINTHMAKMKQTCRKYGVVSYIECNDSDNIATYKKYHSEHLYLLPPQDDDPQEQEQENEAQQEKIKKYLSRLTAKEKQIWELVLQKKSISEVAMIMGYRKPQGVRMAIRRSLAKIRLFAQERQEK